jgi:hypothetical protein
MISVLIINGLLYASDANIFKKAVGDLTVAFSLAFCLSVPSYSEDAVIVRTGLVAVDDLDNSDVVSVRPIITSRRFKADALTVSIATV